MTGPYPGACTTGGAGTGDPSRDQLFFYDGATTGAVGGPVGAGNLTRQREWLLAGSTAHTDEQFTFDAYGRMLSRDRPEREHHQPGVRHTGPADYGRQSGRLAGLPERELRLLLGRGQGSRVEDHDDHQTARWHRHLGEPGRGVRTASAKPHLGRGRVRKHGRDRRPVRRAGQPDCAHPADDQHRRVGRGPGPDAPRHRAGDPHRPRRTRPARNRGVLVHDQPAVADQLRLHRVDHDHHTPRWWGADGDYHGPDRAGVDPHRGHHCTHGNHDLRV